jgi:hypothetical protein
VFYARICLYLNTKQEDGFCFCPFDFRFPRDALFVAPLCPHLADKNTTFARLYFHTNSAQFSHPLRVDAPAPPRSVINIVNVEVYLSSSPLPLFIIYNIIINMYTHTHTQCVFLMGFSLLSLSFPAAMREYIMPIRSVFQPHTKQVNCTCLHTRVHAPRLLE